MAHPFSRKDTALKAAKPGEALDQPISREEIVMSHRPREQIAEQFRSLRNSIHALNTDGASHTLVIASALCGEGKTVATVNLAAAMAELPGNEVLMVDGDLHAPGLESMLGLARRQGLAEVLSGVLTLDQAIRQTSMSGVSVMGAGCLPSNPSELLGSDRMRSLLNQLRQRYSYVLMDTPATMTYSDASLLGAIADGILLVVRLGHTPRHYVEEAHNGLEALGGNVLGLCLTRADQEDTAKEYGG